MTARTWDSYIKLKLNQNHWNCCAQVTALCHSVQKAYHLASKNNKKPLKIKQKKVILLSLTFLYFSCWTCVFSLLLIIVGEQIRTIFQDQLEELFSYIPKSCFVKIVCEKAVWRNLTYKYLFKDFYFKVKVQNRMINSVRFQLI